MTNQDQKVASGGQAIQAGHDVNIHNAMSAEQMMEIMGAMARQLSLYQADAMKIVEERLKSFQEEVFKKFSNSNNANPEAFRDPDFQYLLQESQEAYARSGDEAVRDTLVDIIARRSLETGRTRLAMTLNDAAKKAALLTANEFAALSLCYIVRYTVNNSVRNILSLSQYIRSTIMPFVPNISHEQTSYLHLAAQSCGSLEFGELKFYNILRHNYGGILGRGFTRSELESHLGEVNKNAIDHCIIQCVNDSKKLQPNGISKEIFKKFAINSGVSDQILDNIWTMFENTMYDEKEIIGTLSTHVPEIEDLFIAWDQTSMKNLSLNTVGIAIAHANAVRVINFTPPLNVWIK